MACEMLLYAVKNDLYVFRAFTKFPVQKADQVGKLFCVIFEESCTRRILLLSPDKARLRSSSND